jgi:hypothetical protein
LTGDARDIAAAHREAMRELIFTPAPFSSSVIRKYGIRRSNQFQFMGVSDEEFEAQIAADEAFLKACPRRQKGSVVHE